MKHTPGPWSYIWEKGEYLVDCRTRNDIGIKVICSVVSRVAQDEAEANARLIAAAPEMLEALKEALLEMCVCADRLGTDITTFASYNMVKTSIAKAEGR